MTGEALPQHEVDQHAAAARDVGISCVEIRAVISNLDGFIEAMRQLDPDATYTVAQWITYLESAAATFRAVLSELHQ